MPPQLRVRFAPFDYKINDDTGSGANANLATWRPSYLEPGWYYLGPAANNGGSYGGDGIIVTSAGDDTPALVPIGSWRQVWSDTGSGKRDDFALWEGLPAGENQKDYLVVGGFFTRHHTPPTVEETSEMMAVHKDCVVVVNAGNQIWNDAGTGAKQDGSVWGISVAGFAQTVQTGAFVAADGHNIPPQDTYALDANTIVEY